MPNAGVTRSPPTSITPVTATTRRRVRRVRRRSPSTCAPRSERCRWKASSGSGNSAGISVISLPPPRFHLDLFMSRGAVEFRKRSTSSGEARAHGPDRHAEGGRGFLVTEPGPDAEGDDVLLGARQPRGLLQDRTHLHRGFGARGDVGRLVVSRLARQPCDQMAVTPERAVAITKHVRRDPVEPGQELALDDDDLVPSPECLEKDDRGEILRLRPVGQAAEEIVVDRACVPLVELGERPLIAACARLPERLIAGNERPSITCHMWLMFNGRGKFHIAQSDTIAAGYS